MPPLMKNRIALILAAVFFTAQMLSFQHMAEHGLKEHEHNGKICEVSTYYQQSKTFDSASSAPALATATSYIIAKQEITAQLISLPFFALTQNPRAPPVFFQS